ncbi:hypothetical protein AB0F91_39885 [Amycolatopsis sp. NPDC023774]|uniref:hypothetical protein n=1 Tax=Amycolatopsis sp. NPDC023774 TaxID=3155015 RepID=UPI003406ABFE
MKTVNRRPGWGQGNPLSTSTRREVGTTAQQLAEAMRTLMQELPDELTQDHTPTDPEATPAAAKGNRADRRAQTKAQRIAWREIERRNRKQLLPHYLTAGMVALAFVIHEATANTAGIAALLTGLGATAVGALGYWIARRRKMLLQGWQIWTGTLLLAAAAWMTLAVAVGVTWGTLALAMVADYSLAARWWRRHAHGLTAEEAVAEALADPETETSEPVEIDDSLLARFPQLWADHVGATGYALPGSALIDGTAFDHGIEYVLRLAPGKQDIAAVNAVMSKIATALGVPATRLLAEPYMVRTNDGDDVEEPGLVKFSVILQQPIKGAAFFRSPEMLAGGFIPIGPYIDGRGMAAYRLYTKSRIQNGLLVGSPGTGKSRLLEVIGLVAMWPGYTKVIHIDGQNGDSCPLLWDNTEHYGSEDAELALDRLEAIQHYRELNKPAHLRGKFRPSPDYPGVLVIMDESHRIITKENKERWKALFREANKVGIGFLCADQDPSVQTWHDTALRSFLKAGNGIGLRVDDPTCSRIADSGSDSFNLNTLPRKPGVGYVMKSDHPEARPAIYQGLWAPDHDDAYPVDEATGQPTTVRQIPDDVVLIEEWFARAPKISLDPGSELAKNSVEREITPTQPSTGSPARQSGTGAAQRFLNRRAESHAAPAAGSRAPAPPRVRTAQPQPAATEQPAAPKAAAQAAAAPDTGGHSLDARLVGHLRTVLGAIANGLDQPSVIAEQVGCSPRYANTLLGKLREQGLVDREGAGKAVRYFLTEAGRRAA